MYNDPVTFDDADLSDFVIENGYIPIVSEFVYLGGVISRDCSDEADVISRIQKASNAFGMIRKSLFASSSIKFKVKA